MSKTAQAVTDDDLAGLSEEERAAILDETDDGAAAEGEGADDLEAGDDAGDEGDDSGGKEAEGEGAAAAPGGEPIENPAAAKPAAGDDAAASGDDAAKASATAEGGPAAADADARTEQRPFYPVLEVGDIEALEGKRNSIRAELEALSKTYEDGDIGVAEYTASNNRLKDAELDARLELERAQNAARQNEQSQLQHWQWEQDRFFEESANKIYDDPENSILRAALNQAVKDISNKSDASVSGTQILREADKMVRSKFNLGAAPATKDPKTDTGQGDKGNQAGVRKPNLQGVPNTLSQIPQAEGGKVEENKFSYLDDLSGMEYETALAKLSPEDQQRYLEQ